jgi:hypothetical protein
MHQRYAHARQFKRANRALRKLKSLCRPRHSRHHPQDQGKTMAGAEVRPLLALARRVLAQNAAPLRRVNLQFPKCDGIVSLRSNLLVHRR